MVSPEEALQKAEEEKEVAENYLRDGANWFHDREGELFTRGEVIEAFEEEFDLTQYNAQSVLSGLIGDIVDPVVQVPTSDDKYVGVIEYVEGDGWYGYIDYDDQKGKCRRAVCAQCVHQSEYDHEVTYAKEGEGSFSDGDYTFDELSESIEEHYTLNHDVKPEEVETGASLVSGTTIGGNTAWHAANDGAGSTLNSDFLHGKGPKNVGHDPMYGDGSDGSITRSTNGSENGIINATDYTVQSGVTRTVTSGILMVKATNKITIHGTLDATGYGASGGSGGSGNNGSGAHNEGYSGNSSDIIPLGGGGSGGSSINEHNGGNGGNGDTTSNPKRRELIKSAPEDIISILKSNTGHCGAGGGGGGGSNEDTAYGEGQNASNGSSPGGGGGGSYDNSATNSGAYGGDGGDGGGIIILVAPDIEVSGSIRADGQDGQNGGAAVGVGSGGGGGGSGGVITLCCRTLTESTPTYSVSGGLGGAGGNGSQYNGGDGAAGADGKLIKLTT